MTRSSKDHNTTTSCDLVRWIGIKVLAFEELPIIYPVTREGGGDARVGD